MSTRERSRRRLLPLLIGLLFLLAGLGGSIGAWGAYFADLRIEREGPRAQGLLLKKGFLGVADGDSDYVLEYVFTPEGEAPLKVSRSVGKSLWASLHEGQALEIRYSRENPRRNFPAGSGVTSIGVTIFVSVIAAIFFLLGVALVWGSLARTPAED